MRECPRCQLRFRLPKDRPAASRRFYQEGYRAGFTTSCPDRDALAAMLACGFKGSERDYGAYCDVLRAFGVPTGAVVLDFGSSWGYGSWQLARAGYEVLSYEVSDSRARFARERLGCTTIADPRARGRSVDCLFASHVLEHLGDPGEFWDVAEAVLRPQGTVVCFVPNGDRALEASYGRRTYDKLWGQVHPLLLNGQALAAMAGRRGFSARVYSSPYAAARIAAGAVDDSLPGGELALLARRT